MLLVVAAVDEVALSLSFRTTLSDAILVLGEIQGQTAAYISVELKEGRVQLRYSFPGLLVTQKIPTLSRVNDGRYHSLQFTVLNGIHLSMPYETCTASDSSKFDSKGCRYSESFMMPPKVSMLYIGSNATSRLPRDILFPGPYVGCMRDVELNGNWIYPGQ
ncbi:hypothetical protein EGW08_018753, partial [Elysia chlorotica]